MGEIELGVMFQVWLPIKWMKEFGGPSTKMNPSIFISLTPIPPKSISNRRVKHQILSTLERKPTK